MIPLAALTFLRALPWKWIGIALAVLAVLGGVYLKGRHDDAKAWTPKLEAVQSDLKTCRANGVTLQSAITRQNAAVAALKADSDRRAAEGVKAAQQAHSAAQAASKRAGVIMAAKPGPDLCKSAFDLVREAVR